MAKKQEIAKETAAAAAKAPRTAKPRAPRAQAAHRSRIVTSDASSASVAASIENVFEDRESAIARIAYGYWEERGRQGGSALEDWARAEHEYRQALAATRL